MKRSEIAKMQAALKQLTDMEYLLHAATRKRAALQDREDWVINIGNMMPVNLKDEGLRTRLIAFIRAEIELLKQTYAIEEDEKR